jgi:hypothetical protein
MTNQTPSLALRRVDFCKEMGICAATFYNWKKEGKVKTVKVGGIIYVPRTEIDRILSQAA